MSDASAFVDDLLSVDVLRRVDDACARFENAWKTGQPPTLEAFLSGANGAERTELLRELVRLELHYRQVRGEQLAANDYQKRFSRDGALIREVFAENLTPEAAFPQAETWSDPNATGPSKGARAAVEETEARLPTIPGYEILEVLGRGAMGIVYKARQTALKRLVALKMIRSGEFASPQELVRFRAEAEAIAGLRHPNIVQIYEIGEARGCPFFSLEFLEGGSLERHCAGTPQLPRSAADFIATLAGAMHAAHQSGVVHRDLKPGNVLLSRSALPGGSGPTELIELSQLVPKVTDFGLAKRLDRDSGHTQSGAIMGTPSYMAPEQAEGRIKDVGPAADVYALAAILYELLTGRPPFRGATTWDTIEQVCKLEPVPVRRLQPSVERDLETICLMGMRKDPRQRYATAADLADDLQRWLAGRPILARPVPVWERAWKGARRRPALAAAVGAAMLAVLGLSSGAVFFGLWKAQEAAALQQTAERTRTVQELWVRGQKAEELGRLTDARAQWEKARAMLDVDPAAASDELRGQLESGLESVRLRLQNQDTERGLLDERQQFAHHREVFSRHRDRVLLHSVGVVLRDRDPSADAAEVRRAAKAALAELGLDVRDPSAIPDGMKAFQRLVESPEQLGVLAEECVEVLMAWAEAEAANLDPNGEARALLDAAELVGQRHGLGTPRAIPLRRARCLRLLGDAAGAAAERPRADSIAPARALDFFEMALESYGAGKRDDSARYCESALLRRPGHFGAHYVTALCAVQGQQWALAKVPLMVCVGRQPDDPWLLALRGHVYLGLNDYAAADADYLRALELSPDPAFRAATLTSRSTLRDKQGRRDDAERDLHQAIEQQPNASEGYVNLARLLEKRGDRDGALKQLDRAVERSPKNAAWYSYRGWLRAEAGDQAGARQDFQQVIAWEPPGSMSDRAAAAHVELAHLLRLAGEGPAALAECDAVLAVRPDYAHAYLQRAEVLLALGERNKEAGDALDLYLKHGGKPTPAMHRARGLLHAQQHEYPLAVAAYSQALLLKAEDADTLSCRGWAYLAQEAAQPALSDFNAALTLNPKDADALAGRGTALVMRGRRTDVAGATTAAEQSLALQPKTVERLMTCVGIYARAARVLGNAKDPEEDRCLKRALALLEEAMERVPWKERKTYWREKVLASPALSPLQRAPGMVQLESKYAR